MLATPHEFVKMLHVLRMMQVNLRYHGDRSWMVNYFDQHLGILPAVSMG